MDRYLFDPPAQAETDANREKKEDPAEDIPFDQDLTWPTTPTPAPAIEPTNHTDRDQSDQGRTKDHVDRKPEIYPKGQPGPTTEGHAGHAEPEPAESHEGTMSGPDRSSDTGSAHDAGPKAGEPARKTTAGFDPDEWLAWADKLKANGIRVEEGNSAIQNKLLTGEYAAAMILEENILKLKETKHEPLEVVYPSDGIICVPSPIAIFNTTKNPDGAKALVDWWLSKEGQQAVVKGWMHSVRGDVEPPTGAPKLSTLLPNAVKVNWEKLSTDDAKIKEAFRTRVMD